ncbi:MAG: hypothetical protein JWR20_2449, partial [Marmoricola sp.]|nr:hypothetical protein [Marmoricola sp.]
MQTSLLGVQTSLLGVPLGGPPRPRVGVGGRGYRDGVPRLTPADPAEVAAALADPDRGRAGTRLLVKHFLA